MDFLTSDLDILLLDFLKSDLDILLLDFLKSDLLFFDLIFENFFASTGGISRLEKIMPKMEISNIPNMRLNLVISAILLLLNAIPFFNPFGKLFLMSIFLKLLIHFPFNFLSTTLDVEYFTKNLYYIIKISILII